MGKRVNFIPEEIHVLSYNSSYLCINLFYHAKTILVESPYGLISLVTNLNTPMSQIGHTGFGSVFQSSHIASLVHLTKRSFCTPMIVYALARHECQLVLDQCTQ
jgi:hypothetical protein